MTLLSECYHKTNTQLPTKNCSSLAKDKLLYRFQSLPFGNCEIYQQVVYMNVSIILILYTTRRRVMM